MGKLLRLTSKLYNTPHLMLPVALERAMSYLEDRNNQASLAVELEKEASPREIQYVEETKTGVIPVHGSLTYIQYASMCGEVSCSYQQITQDFNTLVEQGAKTIVLDVDSTGGEAYGMMETGRYLRKKADEIDVKLIAYVDGIAASAAYGIASAAHQIIINQDAEAGSVGVVVRLRNANKAMKNAGVEDTYIYAGDSKIPFDADGEWRQDFLSELQEKVDSLYQDFVGYVSQMRGIDVGVVKSTQAKVLSAKQAINLGLVDKQMTREEFYTYLADLVEGGNSLLSLPFMKTNGVKHGMSLPQDDVAKLSADLLAMTDERNTLLTKLQEFDVLKQQLEQDLSAKAAELQTALADVQKANDEVAKLFAEKQKAKDEARLQQLEAVKSKEEAAELFKSLSALDDVAFSTVMKSLNASAKLETEAFKEVGVQGGQKQEAKAAFDAAFNAMMKKL